jgi:hypothetical protein
MVDSIIRNDGREFEISVIAFRKPVVVTVVGGHAIKFSSFIILVFVRETGLEQVGSEWR